MAISAIPIAKIAYSLILFAVVGVFVFELYRLWLDPNLYVRPFESEGDEAAKEDFAQLVVHAYTELRHKFIQAGQGDGGDASR